MGRPALDLVGQRFGNLVVMEKVPPVDKHSNWKAVCDCGKIAFVRSNHLRAGTTISCGCRKGKHEGSQSGLSTTGAYISWIAMKNRCYNPLYHAYHRYGGRGITVCDSWLDFKNFYACMGERPEGMELDRYPNKDGNYEPGNCRWTTHQNNCDNRGGQFAKASF